MRNRVTKLFTMYRDKFDIQFAENHLKDVESFVIDDNTFTDELTLWFAYSDPVKFEIPWIVDKLTLTSFSKLRNMQVGYRWYDDGITIEGWNINWLVIGQDSGDPIIYDLITKNIYSAIHGIGTWEIKLLADSLSEFLIFIKVWLENLSHHEYEIYDENYILKDTFLDDFRSNLLRNGIAETKYNNFLALA